jgi:hypothetical protein
MPSKRGLLEGAYSGSASQDLCAMVNVRLREIQYPEMHGSSPDHSAYNSGTSAYEALHTTGQWFWFPPNGRSRLMSTGERPQVRVRTDHLQHTTRLLCVNVGSPTGRESYGDGASVVVAGIGHAPKYRPGLGGRESRPQGKGRQVRVVERTQRYAQCKMLKPS